jgi:hypothetical protein
VKVHRLWPALIRLRQQQLLGQARWQSRQRPLAPAETVRLVRCSQPRPLLQRLLRQVRHCRRQELPVLKPAEERRLPWQAERLAVWMVVWM